MANYHFLLIAVCLAVLLPTVAAQGNGTHHQYCFVCETIVNVAKHEHPPTIDALHTLLDKECKNIASFFHDTKACLQIFNNGTNLQTVWTMLQANAHAKAICAAIGMCSATKREVVEQPIITADNGTHHQYCFVCETIVNVAKHEHPPTIDALHTLLDKECKNIASFFHDTKACLQIFNNGTNLQTVWAGLQNGSHAKAICAAIGMCSGNKDNTQTQPQTESSNCKKCLAGSRTFKTLSKSGLSEELMGFCQPDAEDDCMGVVAMDIDMLYEYYQADGHSNTACYHIGIC